MCKHLWNHHCNSNSDYIPQIVGGITSHKFPGTPYAIPSFCSPWSLTHTNIGLPSITFYFCYSYRLNNGFEVITIRIWIPHSVTVLVGWLWRSSSIPQPGILSLAQRTMRKRRTVPRKSLSWCPAHNWSLVPGRHQTSFQLVAQSTFRSSELQNAFLSPRPCVPSYWKSFLEIGKFRLDNLRP